MVASKHVYRSFSNVTTYWSRNKEPELLTRIGKLISWNKNYYSDYTGWPRKNATLTITNIKETMDDIKLMSTLINRTFFFLQNDTKINDFDEGVLILGPFFWGNVIFKLCSFCIKSHVWGREEFLSVAAPDCNAAKLRNKCFSKLLFMLALLYKARADN